MALKDIININLIGSIFIFLVGGLDNLFITLLIFIALDYLTGVIKAIYKKKLNSKLGLKGIFKKLGYIVIVVVATLFDYLIGDNTMAVRSLVIYFFISNEAISILENWAMMGASVVTIPNTYTILHHASQEDLMIMLNLVSPKYYMPVKGEYRLMVNNANLATELGMKPENILLKQNGDVVEFIDGVLQDKFETIKVDDVLVDGKSSDDVGELVIKDREMLGENGIMLISATLDKQTKRILVGPEVTTRGFIYVKDSYDMIEEIKRIAVNIIENNTTPSYVDYNQIKNEIREELSKYFLSETETKPMIIAVIQEV